MSDDALKVATGVMAVMSDPLLFAGLTSLPPENCTTFVTEAGAVGETSTVRVIAA